MPEGIRLFWLLLVIGVVALLLGAPAVIGEGLNFMADGFGDLAQWLSATVGGAL